MHRDGHIVEEIVEYSNMSEAFDRVLRGTDRKKSRQGRKLIPLREAVIKKLTASIADGSFRIHGYRERDIIENGKHRRLQILSMRDRIALCGIMNVVDKHLHRRFIRTTSASIKGRGMHDLMAYIHNDMQCDPEGTRYCYTFDIRKCYENTNQQVAKDSMRRVFKDKKLLAMLDSFITALPTGVSLGFRSSQGIVNLILSVHLDHKMKSEHGFAHYYRYCDNGIILAATTEECREAQRIVHECLEAIGYEIHDERIFPVTEGIDALGYRIYPDHVMLRKRIKQKFARKMKKVKSRKRRRELIASFYGMAKHADCIHLFYTLTGKDMKSFKELNVSFKPEDGKKRFPDQVVSIRELVNLPIVVKDFETGIHTEQGDDRCIVAIEVNGEARKFFTNSEEMKNILAQVKELPDGFPFETVIKTEVFGKGKTKYVFS
jgi:hypothetical protein